MTTSRECAALHDVAAELALGTLDGPARGEALVHLAGCAPCRAHVQELTEAVDQLLALAPEAEPPAGFESAVIARIAEEDRRDAPGHRRSSRLLLAAAALVLALAGLAAGFLLGRGGDAEDDSELATAAMVAPGGDVVGEVWRYGSDEATLVVSVPGWADIEGTDGPRYALRLRLEDGGTVEVGDFGLGDGTSSWGLTAPVEADSIAAVSVVDDTGRVWCTGHFA
jgi:hypothetical protein